MNPPSRIVIVARAVIVSEVAVITAEPADTPTMIPSGATLAFAVSELDHVMVRSRVCPALPVAVALSFTDAPGTIVAVSRASVTAVTAGGVGSGPGPTDLSLLQAAIAKRPGTIASLV